jgi:hypothetical protein
MPQVTHQSSRSRQADTTHLRKQRAASMLAGEPSTDRPGSVPRTIAALLRVYDDPLDGEHRPDLYSLAS